MITGRHTCIHLKGGRMWSTLHQVPIDHDEHVKRCDLHLAYLGFGAFIKLIPRPIEDNRNVIVLGTVTSDDPDTLLQLKQMARDQESVTLQQPKVRPTAAAGSEQDLDRVKSEMDPAYTSVTRKTDSRPIQRTQLPSSSMCSTYTPLTPTPQVLQRPFAVLIRRLTQEEINLHTRKASSTNLKMSDIRNTTLNTKECSVQLDRLLPRDIQDYNVIQAKFRSKRKDHSTSIVPKLLMPKYKTTKRPATPIPKLQLKPRTVKTKKMTVAAQDHTTTPKTNYRHEFSLRKHVLRRKHRSRMYLKCRVKRCPMAYVTFNTVRNLTAHHRLHHHQVTYKCTRCNKKLTTPNSFRLHQYSHQPKVHKCNKCGDMFVHISKLKQHERKHKTHKIYECFHGGCTKKYKHPQDLARHVNSHLNVHFECDFCTKVFKEKRLLKRHQVIHLKTTPYQCIICKQEFKHSK